MKVDGNLEPTYLYQIFIGNIQLCHKFSFSKTAFQILLEMVEMGWIVVWYLVHVVILYSIENFYHKQHSAILS